MLCTLWVTFLTRWFEMRLPTPTPDISFLPAPGHLFSEISPPHWRLPSLGGWTHLLKPGKTGLMHTPLPIFVGILAGEGAEQSTHLR